jgi:hypothetical protein
VSSRPHSQRNRIAPGKSDSRQSPPYCTGGTSPITSILTSAKQSLDTAQGCQARLTHGYSSHSTRSGYRGSERFGVVLPASPSIRHSTLDDPRGQAKAAEGSGLLSLNYFAYNFIKIHRTLRTPPAMAAGVTDRLWSVEDLVALWEAYEQRRGGKTSSLRR